MGLTTECDELEPEGRDEILGCLLNGDGWRGAGGGGSLLQKLLAKTRWPNAATGVWCEEKFQRRG